ncbi:hypothetical protein Clow_01783 [Corynebacterium lowii]|uniref:Rv2525c-like glycoside hydrolase-like domain-containing protein n=1 Tax=Corynebacterium lowii TaxID=1544413 RepID=A0A0Q0Z8X2_9CORY|nr:hypothetical protein Clow_01783 [Corynebacterium lowii]MDP9850530.1 hypothetical protein [Corynebacterium lowii]
MEHLNRRTLLKGAGISLAGLTTLAATKAPRTVVDFSAGVPSAAAIKAAGHVGAVRYVSLPRAAWMKGKPVTIAETRLLDTASVYQYGKGETSDWRRGALGATVHVPQAIALHTAAGGPQNRPIYMAIDDNPTPAEYTDLIRPYLAACKKALEAGGYQLGVYANYPTIERCLADGLGEFFWQHDWGSEGKIHPKATIHQVAGWQSTIEGVTVDINNLYATDWGQWRAA